MGFRLASLALAAVLASYFFLGRAGVTDRGGGGPAGEAYNHLARGFLAGHLHLDLDPPGALVALADPYDPEANRGLREDAREPLHDLSYFRGRLYLYFGATPALLVFIPWHLLTRGWLAQWAATAGLCAAGLLITVSLVASIRRLEFPRAPSWSLAAAVLLVGLASYAPLLLARAAVYEVPIAFGYCAAALALRCLWSVLSRPDRAAPRLALASAALGAAFAARPTVLPAALVLLVPFAVPEVRRCARAWVGVLLPFGGCGLAVALYNAARFGGPFDFGVRYQLAASEVAKLRLFSPAYLGTNLRLYLFQAVDGIRYFPWVHEAPQPPVPPFHAGTEHMSGALLNAPVLWLALALPLLLRARGGGRSLGLFALAVAWMAGASLLTLSLFFGCCSRYQFEFVPELALLAALGILALESLPASPPRTLARWGWIPALALSCAFPVLYGIDRCVTDHAETGFRRLEQGDGAGAERDFEAARALSPSSPAARLGAGQALLVEGRLSGARAVFEALVRDEPDNAMAHFLLGRALSEEGQVPEAIAEYATASGLEPRNETIRIALEAARGRRP